MRLHYNLNKLSAYRTELMGLATLLIIICHAPANGVQMSGLVEKALRWGGIGVDIFLFLSGIGMYYSLKETSNHELGKWYIHRYLRIIIPYLVFSVPYYIFRWIIDDESIWIFLCNITTLNFWLRHEGAWFVAMLIPLYFLTPWIASFVDRFQNRLIPVCFLCVIAVVGKMVTSSNSIVNNVQMCLGHVPSFFVGYWIGKYVNEAQLFDKRMAYISIGGGILYVLFLIIRLPKNWLLVIPSSILISWIIDRKPHCWFNRFFKFLGTISLESYLMNIYLPVVLRKAGFLKIMTFIDRGNYLFYTVVILLGLLTAYYGHRLCQGALQKIDSKITNAIGNK